MTSLLKLRLALAVFFLALAVPAVALIYQAYLRLQWETFHQHQSLAEGFATQVDQSLREVMRAEDARSFTEYNFFNVVSPTTASLLQRSPLAIYPPPTSVPGLIGHFQVDTEGAFSTPLLPPPEVDSAAAGIESAERERRQALASHMRDILAANRLISTGLRDKHPYLTVTVAPAERQAQVREERDAGLMARAAPTAASADKPPAQVAFDSLNESRSNHYLSLSERASSTLGRVDDLKLEQKFQGKAVMADAEKKDQVEQSAKSKRSLRKEAIVQYELSAAAPSAAPVDEDRRTNTALRVRTFESEVDGFETSLIDSGELVVFRKVRRDGQRYVQGLIIDWERFFAALATAPFDASALARSSALVVARL